MKPKKYDYYKLDVGFYPDVMKLCFDDKVFQQILKDHSITLKASALDTGVAETHQIGDGKQGIIILAFNINEIGDTTPEVFDTIAHEVSHSIDHLAEFIGEEDGISGETRAYLTGSLVKQIFKIYEHEKEKNARKASRKVSDKKGQRKQGTQLQVDQLGDRGAGPNSASQPEGTLCGTENSSWGFVPTPDVRVC